MKEASFIKYITTPSREKMVLAYIGFFAIVVLILSTIAVLIWVILMLNNIIIIDEKERFMVLTLGYGSIVIIALGLYNRAVLAPPKLDQRECLVKAYRMYGLDQINENDLMAIKKSYLNRKNIRAIMKMDIPFIIVWLALNAPIVFVPVFHWPLTLVVVSLYSSYILSVITKYEQTEDTLTMILNIHKKRIHNVFN